VTDGAPAPGPPPDPDPAAEADPAVEARRLRRRQAADEHERVLAAGGHLLQQLSMRDVVVEGCDLAVEMDLDGRVTNPRGALQGGLMATLVDIVAGRAVLTGGPRDGVATSDLTIHYLRGLTVGPARAAATVVRRGARSAVVSVDVVDAGSGSLCAVATVGFSVTPTATPTEPVP